MQTSEVLERAADHIQQYGHHKGGGFAGDCPWTSPACTHGAIVAAARGESEAVRAAAQAAVRRYLGTHNISGWNDEPVRTAAEVVEVLRAAAMVERTREAALEAVSS